MGTPKALLRFDGLPMIARVARALEDTCDELVVVAAAEAADDSVAEPGRLRAALAETAFGAPRGALRFARDLRSDLGPVAGLAAGLAAASSEHVVVVPCDLPLLSAAFVRGLFELAQSDPPPDVVAARRGGFWEPMPAVLRRAPMAALYAGQLERGELRPTAGWPGLRVLAVEGETLARLDPDGSSFLGVNDRADLDRALARLARSKR